MQAVETARVTVSTVKIGEKAFREYP